MTENVLVLFLYLDAIGNDVHWVEATLEILVCIRLHFADSNTFYAYFELKER